MFDTMIIIFIKRYLNLIYGDIQVGRLFHNGTVIDMLFRHMFARNIIVFCYKIAVLCTYLNSNPEE